MEQAELLVVLHLKDQYENMMKYSQRLGPGLILLYDLSNKRGP